MPKQYESLEACLAAVSSALKQKGICDEVRVLCSVSKKLLEWADPLDQPLDKSKMMNFLFEVLAFVHRMDPKKIHEQSDFFTWALENIFQFYKMQLQRGGIKSLSEEECDAFNALFLVFSRWVDPHYFYSKLRLVTASLLLSQCYSHAETKIDDSGLIALINAFSLCVSQGPTDEPVKTVKVVAQMLRGIGYNLNCSQGTYDETTLGNAVYFLMESIKSLYSLYGVICQENQEGLVSILGSIALMAKKLGMTLLPDSFNVFVRTISFYDYDKDINKVDLHHSNLDSLEAVIDLILGYHHDEDFILVVGRGNQTIESSIKQLFDPILKINRLSGPIKSKALAYLEQKKVVFAYTLDTSSGRPNEGSIYVARTDMGHAIVQNLLHKTASLVENKRISPLLDTLSKSPRSHSGSPSKFMPISPILENIKKEHTTPEPVEAPASSKAAPPSIMITAPSQDRLHTVLHTAPKAHAFSALSNQEKIKYLCFIELSLRGKMEGLAYVKLRTEILTAIKNESDVKFKYQYLNLLKTADFEHKHSSRDIDKIIRDISSGLVDEGKAIEEIDKERNDYDPDYMVIDSMKL